jgi:hypothetical protein
VVETDHVVRCKIPTDVQYLLCILDITGNGDQVIGVSKHATPGSRAVGVGKAVPKVTILDGHQKFVNKYNEEERAEETPLFNSILHFIRVSSVGSQANSTCVVLIVGCYQLPEVSRYSSVVESCKEWGATNGGEGLSQVEEQGKSIRAAKGQDFIQCPGMSKRAAFWLEPILLFWQGGDRRDKFLYAKCQDLLKQFSHTTAKADASVIRNLCCPFWITVDVTFVVRADYGGAPRLGDCSVCQCGIIDYSEVAQGSVGEELKHIVGDVIFPWGCARLAKVECRFQFQ